ncbi:MAG TPA: DUF6152 family protein [Gammaproteobacteria bacterium]
MTHARLGSLSICIAWLGPAMPAFSHHSNDYHFDRNVDVTVSGTVNEFRFINPHSRLLVDVVGEDGDIVTWDCEMGAANGLKRRGWTDDVFRPGEAIVIQGFAARRNQTECYFDYADMSDGRHITMDDRYDADAPVRPASVVASALPDGVPDFSRVWQRDQEGGGGGPRLGGPNRQAWVLNEAGESALAAYDPVTDDPSLDCSPVSIVRLWGNGDLTRIMQEQDRVTIQHEWMDARRVVHLGISEHPADLPHNVLGHSIGWYEGSTLVIDTIGYPYGVLHQHPGLPHSDALHTIERLTLSDDGDSFELSYIAEDEKYFHDQLTGTRSFVASSEAMRDYDCTH